MQESLTARRSAQSAARGARGVTAAPAIITLSRRHAALSEAGTVLRPSDALATCSCEPQAVPDAATRAEEPHSAPQHSAARRLPREPLAASHRPPTALPSRRRPVAHGVAGAVRRPSATVAIGSCEPEAAHSAALLVREHHSVPQPAAARRSPRGSPEALQPLQRTCPLITLRASCRAQRGRGGAKAARRSGRQLMRATGRAQRHSTSGGASQHAAARGVARGSPEAIRRLRRCPLSAGVLPRSARQGRP